MRIHMMQHFCGSATRHATFFSKEVVYQPFFPCIALACAFQFDISNQYDRLPKRHVFIAIEFQVC
jgi:hypothetical protein